MPTAVSATLFDFGDAPDPVNATPGRYPTLLTSDGARHALGSGLFLGAAVDAEPDGEPNSTATADQGDDGVILPSTLVARLGAQATVTASQAGKLDAWIDFNRDGAWDVNDQIADSLPLLAGQNTITFDVPANSFAGRTFARFRLSSAGDLAATGEAADGEVEDYSVQLAVPPAFKATVFDDPLYPGQRALVAIGSGKADQINLTQTNDGSVTAKLVSGTSTFNRTFAGPFGRVVAFGLAGDDTLVSDTGANLPVWLFGNGGNDQLTGGRGPNVLVGDVGADTLRGRGHRDILIGGHGRDTLEGQGGQDLLIAGFTAFEVSSAGLAAIRAEWTRTDADYGTRVQHLNGLSGGRNGSVFLNDITLYDDGVQDTLIGGPGIDVFYLNTDGTAAGTRDIVKDKVDGELLFDTDVH